MGLNMMQIIGRWLKGAATRIFELWRLFVIFLSSEWILTKLDIPNGGAVILFRSLVSSIYIFLLVLGFVNAIDPTKSWVFSYNEFEVESIDKFVWFGAIFAAVYTGLYARFASQWSYLANLYNTIKQTEANSPEPQVMAEWKAGFLEDADNLHVACKGTFVTTIKVWGDNEAVKTEFIKHSPGGEERFKRLMNRVNESIRIHEEEYRAF